MDCYIRVSRLGERGEEESTEVYEAQCREWADRQGEHVDEVVDDTDVSGSVAVAERGLERLVQRCESGESTGIITPYLDRFGRDLIEGALALKRITDAGGRLIAVRDGFDSTSPGSELVFNLRMSIAQDFLQRTRANWRAAVDRAVERGAYLSATTPFGYRREESTRRLIVDERAALLVVGLFERRAGGANLGELLRWLQAEDVDSLRAEVREAEGQRPPKPLTKSGLRSILKNRAYIGEATAQSDRRGEPRVIRANHPPILTEEVWEAGQVKHDFVPRNGLAMGARLRGLVVCASCGRRCKVGAYGPPERRTLSYTCTSGGCHAHASIKAENLDGHVEALLMQAAADHEPHVEAVILGDTRYQDAMRAVEEARDTFEEFRDSVEMQRELGIEGFAKGLRVRKEALRLARRDLSRVRPAERRVRSGGSAPTTREAVEAAIGTETNARFIDRVVLRPTGGGPRPPTAERVEVYWVGADSPA